MAYTVVLLDGTPWGFRLQGGKEFNEPITIAKINPNSKAYNEGLEVGDFLDTINGDSTNNLMHNEALQLIRNASDRLHLELRRASSNKPIPEANKQENGDINHNVPGYWSGDEGLCKPVFSTVALDTGGTVSQGPDDISGSSSDSQSSIILANGAAMRALGAESAEVSPSSGNPSASIWSPFGGTRSVSYKPISFGSSPSSLKSSPCTTPSPQRRHQQQQEQHQFFDSQTDVVGREQDHGHDRQENQDEESQRKEESWTAETPLVWSPYGQKSPSSPRKGYSPVRLHSTGKHKILNSDSSLKPDDTFAWSACDQTTTATSTLTTSTVTTTTSACSSTPSPTWNSTITHISETRSSLPTPQSPTITLLQKSRDMESEAVSSAPPPPPPAQPHAGPLGFTEGQLPKGATYIKSEEPAERKVRQTDSYHTLPAQRTTTVTIAEKKVPPEPVRSSSLEDKDRSTPVSPCLKKDETNQKEWYKKMYKTLHTEHKSKSRETNPYRPSYEFPKKWNDSDDTARSLDRYTVTGMGRKGTWSPATARYRNEVYKNQPKSIEDYEPGLSSIALRENKVYVDAAKRPSSKRCPRSPQSKGGASPAKDENYKEASLMFNPPIEKPGQYSKYTIKENHSERGFKKTPRPASPVSEADIKLAYKMIQKGGEIPTSGLCLPSHKKKDHREDLNSPLSFSTSSTESISLNKKSTAKINFDKPRSRSFSGRDRPRNMITVRDRHGSSSPSPSSPQHHRHSASDLTSPGPSSEPRVTPTQVGVRGEGDGQGTLSQRRREEEVARRKAEMDRISMEQKQRRLQEEEAANAARRHNDVYLRDEEYWLRYAGVLRDPEDKPNKISPSKLDSHLLDIIRDRPKQKSPIPPAVDRFEEADPRPQHRPNKKVGHIPRGKAQARYNFGAQNPKELSFKKGDTIYLLRKIDNNWYEGEHHGRVGIFPANYVKVITSLETAHAAAHGREGVATARYNFTPQTSVELPLRKGDEVHLVRQVDDNWYEGRAGGRHGIFPAAYVDIIKEPDTPLGTPMSSVAGTPMMGSPGSTISNGPTIPDGPESPYGFDQYSVSSYGHSTASPGSQHSHQQHQQLHHQHQHQQQQQLQQQHRQHQQRQHQQLQHQQYHSHHQQQQVHPGHHNTRPIQSIQTSSSAPLHSAYNGNVAGTGPYQRDSYASNYSDRTPSYGMPNGHGDGSYGTVGSRHSYSSNRGYREEEPRYPKYRAMYRYLQQNEDELELNEGDTIYVMEKCDDGWFVGLSARTKEFGTFPGNYVQPF